MIFEPACLMPSVFIRWKLWHHRRQLGHMLRPVRCFTIHWIWYTKIRNELATCKSHLNGSIKCGSYRSEVRRSEYERTNACLLLDVNGLSYGLSTKTDQHNVVAATGFDWVHIPGDMEVPSIKTTAIYFV